MAFFIKNSSNCFKQFFIIGLVSLFGSCKMYGTTIEKDSLEIVGRIVFPTEATCNYRLTISTTPADTLPPVIVFSNVYKSSPFNFKLEQVTTPLTLSINAVGFQPVHIKLGVLMNKHNIGTIELEKDSTHHLPAVLVMAKKPLIIEQGMKTRYNISGSMLSEAGTLTSLFRRLPNLSMNNGKLSVLDSYGIETVILLNERELRDPSLLEVLNAKDVKSIEIDRNPNILYQGKIVVKIETVKRINDYVYHDIDLTYTQGRRAYGDIGTNLRSKFGNLSMGISYRYSRNNSMIDDEEFRLMPEEGTDLYLLDKSYLHEKENKHNLLVDLEYMLNNKTNLSLLYNSTFTQQKNDIAINRSMLTPLDLKHINIIQQSPILAHSHSLSLGLTKEIGKGNLTLLADYAVTKNTTDYSTTEQNPLTSHYQRVKTEMDSHSHLANILGKYSFTAPWEMAMNIGLKSSIVAIPTNYYVTTSHGISLPSVQDVNTMEQSNVLFLNAEKWITKRLQLEAGVSYDFTYQHVKYKENGQRLSFHKQYHNIIPSFSIGYLFSPQSFATIGLSIPFVKPHFEDIIPAVIYKDALLYQQRKLDVKATRTYVFSGMWKYKSLFIRALISHCPLFYERTYERLSSSSFAMKSVIAPFHNQTFSQLSMSYSKQWNSGIFLQATGNFYYRPNFINGEVAKHQLTYFPMLTMGYNKRTLYTWVACSYLNETSNGIQWVERTGFNIDAGATISLLKDKLTMDATFPNILRIKVPTQYSINGGMKWGVHPINRDCEYFNVTLKYKLFNKDIRLQQQQGNTEELNRLLK